MPEVTDSITGEVVPGAMETVIVRRERSIDDRLRDAYRAAIALSNNLSDPAATVRIHLGSEVRDYLRRLVAHPAPGRPDTMFSFPVVLEPGFAPQSIVIRAEVTVV